MSDEKLVVGHVEQLTNEKYPTADAAKSGIFYPESFIATLRRELATARADLEREKAEGDAAVEELRGRLAEARATLARYPERWYSEQTMAAVAKERDAANAKLAAVTLDNARLRGIVGRYMSADPSDATDAPETQMYKDATEAYFSTPDTLAQEVRDVLREVRNEYSEWNNEEGNERAEALDALLAKLPGAGEGGKA